MKDTAGVPLGLRTHRLQEIWNGGDYRDLRRRIYAGEAVDACSLCYKNERTGVPSYRQWANKYWLEDHPEAKRFLERIHRSAREGFAVEKPVSFDLRIGNTCNLKCRMCNPTYSSQIERDEVHGRGWLARDMPKKEHRFSNNLEDWSRSSTLLDEIVEFAGDVELIQLAGGEPTINRTQTEWLEHLVSSGRAGKVVLTIWTNLTNVKDSYFDLLARFKQLTVMVSCDGYGPTFEYIRFPAKWAQLEANIRKLRSIPRARVTITPVLQAYNLLTITDLYRWADASGIDCIVNPLHDPDYLDTRVVPAAGRELAAARLEAYVAEARDKGITNSDLFEALLAIAKQIGHSDHTAPPQTVQAFIEFTNDLDVSRRQDISRACPDLHACFLKEYGDWRSTTRFAARQT
jgi:MoaA/NifB/PqqE/SkfB family radical SAM enzyme